MDELICFQTAKLAKLAGFDLYKECSNGFSRMGQEVPSARWNLTFQTKESIARPTQSMLQRWLREKHNIYVEIHRHSVDKEFSIHIKFENTLCESYKTQRFFKSYEIALEEALQESLNQIL